MLRSPRWFVPANDGERMKMTDCNNDREKCPLMKDLHETGLKHGVTMVVVAIPMKADDPRGVHPLLIDHNDDTTVQDVISKFTGAGVYLIKAANAAEEYAAELAETEEPAPAESP
jgi:hypothetical protein